MVKVIAAFSRDRQTEREIREKGKGVNERHTEREIDWEGEREGASK